MASVLVTDGDTRSALSIARSLGRRGHRVIIGAEVPRSISYYSKHCSERFLYPSPSTDRGGFEEAIIEYVSNNEVDLLIPVSDLTSIPVSTRKDELAKHTTVCCPDRAMMDKAFDKHQTLKAAQSLGVPIPETQFAESLDEVRSVAGEISYPAVVKPRRSWYWIDGKAVSGSRRYVSSREELLRAYQEMSAEMPPPIIQEMVHGDGCGLFALTSNGAPLATFAHRRLREFPVSGGVSTLRESVVPDEKVREYGTRLLEGLGWEGVAMVEFKMDDKAGVPRLMEVNGRFWGSLDLAVESGVDFPHLLVQHMTGQPVGSDNDYRIGHRSRWFRGDLERVVMMLDSPKYSRGEKIKAIGQAINFVSRDVSYDTMKVDDPLPGLIELLEFTNCTLLRRSPRMGVDTHGLRRPRTSPSDRT